MNLVVRLQALQQLKRWVAISHQALALLILAQACSCGGPHHAIRRARGKAALGEGCLHGLGLLARQCAQVARPLGNNAAIARQAWAVQGNSALADYYWASLGDYEEGHFADPAKQLKTISLEQANAALRELFAEPGYIRIEKPLFGYHSLSMAILGVLALLIIVAVSWRAWRRR